MSWAVRHPFIINAMNGRISRSVATVCELRVATNALRAADRASPVWSKTSRTAPHAKIDAADAILIPSTQAMGGPTAATDPSVENVNRRRNSPWAKLGLVR